MANTPAKTPKAPKSISIVNADASSVTRSFVISFTVSQEIDRRATAEDRSASQIVKRALQAYFNGQAGAAT